MTWSGAGRQAGPFNQRRRAPASVQLPDRLQRRAELPAQLARQLPHAGAAEQGRPARSPPDERGCVTCHQGGNLFQRFGIFGSPTLRAGSADDELGRFALTGKLKDRHVLRAPSLRNVAATAPYLHDGRAASLEEAVEIMGRNQLGQRLRQRDVRLIVAFLRTLTGEKQGEPLPGDAGPDRR